jgi:integrase
MLQEHKIQCSKVDGYTLKSFIFGGASPYRSTTIARYKNSYCKLAGVKEIRIHDFRHSHASLLISNGADPTIVAQRLGHTGVEMTLNIYSHMFPNKQAEIIKKLCF